MLDERRVPVTAKVQVNNGRIFFLKKIRIFFL